MKKTKKILALICACVIAVTPLTCFAEDTVGDWYPSMSSSSFEHLLNLYYATDSCFKEAGYTIDSEKIIPIPFMLHDSWYYSKEDELLLPLISDITNEEFCIKYDEYTNCNSKNLDFFNLTPDGKFCTGSVIKYKGENADKRPFESRTVIFGDIMGGEETLGDGKVNILDLVKLRHNIVNQKIDEIKKITISNFTHPIFRLMTK